jgi:hypothetical protein
MGYITAVERFFQATQHTKLNNTWVGNNKRTNNIMIPTYIANTLQSTQLIDDRFTGVKNKGIHFVSLLKLIVFEQ